MCICVSRSPTLPRTQGAPAVWRIFGGTPVYLGPASFVQANTSAMQHALDSMQRFIPDNAVLADLHAGVGTIGMLCVGGNYWYACVGGYMGMCENVCG